MPGRADRRTIQREQQQRHERERRQCAEHGDVAAARATSPRSTPPTLTPPSKVRFGAHRRARKESRDEAAVGGIARVDLHHERHHAHQRRDVQEGTRDGDQRSDHASPGYTRRSDDRLPSDPRQGPVDPPARCRRRALGQRQRSPRTRRRRSRRAQVGIRARTTASTCRLQWRRLAGSDAAGLRPTMTADPVGASQINCRWTSCTD
jgi:hypothetical protein